MSFELNVIYTIICLFYFSETEKLFEDGDDDMFARKTPKPISDKPKKPPVVRYQGPPLLKLIRHSSL